jgi:hypothetical protein
MGGGLMQLVAYGAQDIYLTGNPQITFFKVVYRRHTNFSMECIQQTISGSSTVGSASNAGTVTISRNGDLVSGIHIASSTLGIHHGDELVQDVELEIGGQKIDKHVTEWMQIWTELTTPKGKKDGVAYMTAAAGHNSAGLTSLRGIDGVGTVILPLQFWFCRNPGLALPLIALQYHEVKLKINWGTTTKIVASAECEVWADYVYLDTDERRRFAQVSHEYLIEQVQQQSSTPATSVKLNFNHPIKELIWTNLDSNYYDNCKIQLNGHDRFAKQPPEYFQLKQVNDHHTSIPRVNTPTLGSHKTHFALQDGLLADISEGLNGTAATTLLEFNLFVTNATGETAAGAGTTSNLAERTRHPNTAKVNGDAKNGELRLNAIALADFAAQSGTAASRFIALNGTAAANALVKGCLIIGHTYNTTIGDVDSTDQTINGNKLVALYKRTGDGTVAAGIGPVATLDSLGHAQRVTAAGTTMKAGMVICEFQKDIFNNTDTGTTGKTLADNDTLDIGILADSSALNKGGVNATALQGEATSLVDMINVYSFALKPEEHQPSGTCNFSRIDNAKLIFDTAPAGTTLNIYAVNYNVLRIMSGMGGLAYSN